MELRSLLKFQAEQSACIIFPTPHPRAIFLQMSEPGTTYVVSANEMLDTGKRRWKTLLVTKDEAAAESLKAAIEADGVPAEIIRPARKPRSRSTTP
jgi:hypothetical protein